jgi:hypothetical protein
LTVTTWTPLAGKRVQIDRQGRDQRLAFAGLHLRDIALVQHHAADQLHVEGPHAERPLGALAGDGEGRHQQFVDGLALGDLGAELVGLAAQLFVAQRGHLAFQRIDGGNPWMHGLQTAIIDGTENFAG